ncbi:hypothetical protein M1563_04210 [Patescibacteria group bacterium]|nr:hypothetical protein [Patescibacteria group bacterium]
MPALTNPKTKLTYGEHRRMLLDKLEKNPDDPDPKVQELKKELEEFKEAFVPRQEELNEVGKAAIEAVNNTLVAFKPSFEHLLPIIQPISPPLFDYSRFYNNLLEPIMEYSQTVNETLKQLTIPTSTLVNIVNTINSSSHFISGLNAVMESLKTPHFALVLESINPTLGIIKNIQEYQTNWLANIDERMIDGLKPPEITFIPPPSRDHEIRMALYRLEARFDRFLESQDGGIVEVDPDICTEVLAKFPDTGKYRDLRSMARKLLQQKSVPNFHMAKSIYPTLKKSTYGKTKESIKGYNNQVYYRIRVLRGIFRGFNLEVVFTSAATKLVSVESQ